MPPPGPTWINTAHQGLLSERAAAAAAEAIRWKREPWELTVERFSGVPQRLREALGRLLSCPAEDVVLANSSSYGIHLVANGFPWQPGDEVLLVRGDFPSTILPWLGLAERGVTARYVAPRGAWLTAEDVAGAIGPRTRVLCTTWVHSFAGHAIDERAIGALCRERGVAFVLNAAQGVGARLLALAGPDAAPVDAVTAVGFKWLRGPYGTGFAWVRPELRERLSYNQQYWLSMQTAADLEREGEPELREGLGARRYDVFGTANFFNFTAWAAAIEELLETGIEQAAAHDQRLVEAIAAGVEAAGFELVSPRRGPERSTLVLFSHPDPAANREIYDGLRRRGIYLAMRRGRLRASPHVHNTEADVARLLAALAEIQSAAL